MKTQQILFMRSFKGKCHPSVAHMALLKRRQGLRPPPPVGCIQIVWVFPYCPNSLSLSLLFLLRAQAPLRIMAIKVTVTMECIYPLSILRIKINN